MTCKVLGIFLLLALLSSAAAAQRVPHAQSTEAARKAKLAKALCSAKPEERQAAIDAVVSSPEPALRWLLAWVKCPFGSYFECKDGPPAVYGVIDTCLFDSMAQVFGRLRVKEAIPYLIENIWWGPGPLRKGDPELSIESPSIHALIQIGPEATPALLQALRRWPAGSDGPSGKHYHLGILTVLANTGDPRARPALEQAAKERGYIGEVARLGLKRLDDRR